MPGVSGCLVCSHVESLLSSTDRPDSNTSGLGSGCNVVPRSGEGGGEVSRNRSVHDDRKAVPLNSDAAGYKRLIWKGVRGHGSKIPSAVHNRFIT